jgi:hypothetical protein
MKGLLDHTRYSPKQSPYAGGSPLAGMPTLEAVLGDAGGLVVVVGARAVIGRPTSRHQRRGHREHREPRRHHATPSCRR